MRLVGLCSTYREGRLARMAIASALAACEQVYVFEGPAGDARLDECAATEVPTAARGRIVYRAGEWRTDAAKRTAIVRATRGLGPGPTWGVWVDGDEVLVQGEFLYDLLAALVARDDPAEPAAGFPIRLVEMDGSVAVCRAKVVRLDLIERYIVSSSGIVFKNGNVLHERAEGNLPQAMSEWWTPERMQAVREDRMMLQPPLPGEPYLLHRSPLREPSRQAVRMHEQEATELERLGLWTPASAAP